MKNIYLFSNIFVAFFLLAGFHPVKAQNGTPNRDFGVQNVICFNPEIFPDIDEIKQPTYSAFFSAVSDNIITFRNIRMLRVDSEILYDNVDIELLREFCLNNNAQFAVVPKVKYFKVGIGKYVFSNQVIVSMKLFDATGNLITETSYDTYKKNARLLGSAENSIKIGSKGAIKNIRKNLRKYKKENFTMLEDLN